MASKIDANRIHNKVVHDMNVCKGCHSMVRSTEQLRRIRGEEFNGVLDDLAAFTGMAVDEIMFRIVRKTRGKHGARGWYDDEFDWHSPRNDRELAWFYRAAQSYVFSNARRPHWEALRLVKDLPGPVLDYGCGIGQNVIELAMNGMTVYGLEIGVVQQEFVEFRISRHGLADRASIIKPYHAGKFDPVGCLSGRTFGTVILQHVLEHIPEYPKLLRRIIGTVEIKGVIIEQSPFGAPVRKESLAPRVHFDERVSVEQIMNVNGMRLERRDGSRRFNPSVWRKVR